MGKGCIVIKVLYILESLRVPLLDEIMLFITQFGEETAFLVAALIVFWCVDKRKGYYLMTVGFIGTILNQFLKLWFRVPRPWVIDPEFTIVEQAREAATGYSFPSGHSQNAVGTFGALSMMAKKPWLRILWGSIAVMVPLSRMYLGVHTPMDVLVGSGMALALLFLLRPMVGGGKEMKPLLIGMLAMAMGLLLFVELFPFPLNMDPHNLESGLKNAYTMIGCIIGVSVVYVVDLKYVNFETKAVWWVQFLKILVGLGTVLLIKEGLRMPLEMVLPVYPARAIRYFLIVVWAGIGWPSFFHIFAKLGVKK